MYGYPASGYAMSAGGVPVAIPMQAMQAGASGAAAQGYHQPMVLVPVPGAAGGQQLIAQATSPGGDCHRYPSAATDGGWDVSFVRTY